MKLNNHFTHNDLIKFMMSISEQFEDTYCQYDVANSKMCSEIIDIIDEHRHSIKRYKLSITINDTIVNGIMIIDINNKIVYLSSNFNINYHIVHVTLFSIASQSNIDEINELEVYNLLSDLYKLNGYIVTLNKFNITIDHFFDDIMTEINNKLEDNKYV